MTLSPLQKPLGPMWNIFGNVPQDVSNEIERLLHKLITTLPGQISFIPEFGVTLPKAASGREIILELEKKVRENYGEYLKACGFALYVEKMAEKLRMEKFPTESREFFQLRISNGRQEWLMYWNNTCRQWQMRSHTRK